MKNLLKVYHEFIMIAFLETKYNIKANKNTCPLIRNDIAKSLKRKQNL